MSETVQVRRDGRILIGATDLIHSPDDNGWYFSETDFRLSRGGHRTSIIYKTEAQAKAAWRRQAVKWDDWY